MLAHNQDLAPLIALLRWRQIDGRVLKSATSRRAKCFVAIKPCLKCGLRPVDVLALRPANSRAR
jgi:hypothetical protein